MKTLIVGSRVRTDKKRDYLTGTIVEYKGYMKAQFDDDLSHVYNIKWDSLDEVREWPDYAILDELIILSTPVTLPDELFTL